ncbi:uncharacterized protein TM35_000041190 [Trypanosoma theileri]|uniref:Uncharacterized protein n=1 Tax=Trypanosoma theileri TaxID=67003 RepID=A0A1X0P4V6_9TRYP|nr:uncharacterized protein TM35_000041190 [Trypanosoma theileri]ORC91905.1 hypothetical protein TM35_000041190 [Trypanosoma theileri]
MLRDFEPERKKKSGDEEKKRMKPGNQSTRAMLEARCRVLPFSFFYPSPQEGGGGEHDPTTQGGRPTCQRLVRNKKKRGGGGSRGFFTYEMSGVGHSGKRFAFPTSTLSKMGLKGIPQR